MAEIGYIKDMYENEGLSLREIARRTKKDFRTVQKYAKSENWTPEVEVKMAPEEYPVLGPYIPEINTWLEGDETEPRKQRHTIMRVYERLRKEQGYEGSYSTVKRYYHRKKEEIKKREEGYLALTQPKGHAEADFGEFKYYDGDGENQGGHALVVTFPYSNAGWMQVYRGQNQECLLEGLKRIFGHIGGVPVRIRLDNMPTAVAQMLEGRERVLTEGFARFKMHHRFETEFCNASRGNEKGNVENKVGYGRRNLLVPVPVIEEFESYNEELLGRCDADHEREHYRHGRKIREIWTEEKGRLLRLPEHEYEVYRYEALSANKYGYVTIDTNKYGLSPTLAGKQVQAKIYHDRVELYYEGQLMKSYARSYGRGQEVTDWKQYLPVLVGKPGAAEHTRFFGQLPKLWRRYLKSVGGKERKSALMVLSEIVADGNEAMCDEALELAGEYGRLDSDNIRQCYLFIAKPENHPKPLELASRPPVLNYQPDLTAYDSLTGGAIV
jgi:transposase